MAQEHRDLSFPVAPCPGLQMQPLDAFNQFDRALRALRDPHETWFENTLTGQRICVSAASVLTGRDQTFVIRAPNKFDNKTKDYRLTLVGRRKKPDVCLEWDLSPGPVETDTLIQRASSWTELAEKLGDVDGICESLKVMLLQIGGVTGYRSAYRLVDVGT